jgi:urocanate hydratase
MQKTKSKYDPVKYKTPTGTGLNCKGWIQEAALRMLHNNLDPRQCAVDFILHAGNLGIQKRLQFLEFGR